ncbi:unnamed protein product, partial [marine sediment metagenome]
IERQRILQSTVSARDPRTGLIKKWTIQEIFEAWEKEKADITKNPDPRGDAR